MKVVVSRQMLPHCIIKNVQKNTCGVCVCVVWALRERERARAREREREERERERGLDA